MLGLQRSELEDLVVRDDSSFALPRVIPAMGVTPVGKSDESE
jgi:hypothetical protein